MPTGSADLILRLGEGTSGQRVLVGPSSTFSHLQTSAPVSVLGVHFRPGGVSPFLGVPAGEVRDLTLSLDALWGAQAGEPQERLLGEATLEAKFRALERALLPVARAATPHPAVPFALSRWHRRPSETVAELADPSNLCLYVPDVDAVYERALRAGGKSVRVPETQYYGDRCGGVEDGVGNVWWIATHVEDVSAEEMKRRAAQPKR